MVVYVIGNDGRPLMPTTRFGKVRRMLRSGMAEVVSKRPFTIRLLYETEHHTQPVVLGVDPGRQNIGLTAVLETGETIYSAKVTTRNKDIPKLVENRAASRRIRRSHERERRRRRAKKYDTSKGAFERRLPGCEVPIVCNDIKNSESRFNNRARSPRWLSPTARHLLETHLHAIDKVKRLLPVTDICVEINRFAFLQLEDPDALGIDFQNGPLKGFTDVYDAIWHNQHGKCFLCGEPIEHYHHITQRKDGGADTMDNLVGLCKTCHKKVHQDPAIAEKLKNGKAKKYRHLSVLNQIIPYLWEALCSDAATTLHAAFGNDTACMREMLRMDKDHHIDAYVIACNGYGIEPAAAPPEYFSVKQYRRHNRAAMHQANYNREYVLDGKKIAVNRGKSADQKGPALADVVLTDAERSRLTVKLHPPAYKTPKEYTPGSLFIANGVLRVLNGYEGTHKNKEGLRISNYCVDTNGSKHRFTKSEFVYHNTGLVYV